MKTIIIDNKDSFTYNLAHYVESLNFSVDVYRGDAINIEDLDTYDKIILSPGPGLPKEHPILDKIISRFYRNKSILGICLGHQAIASYFHAEIINLSNVKHGVQSTIYHKDNCTVFKDLPLSFQVGHYHSWVVSSANIPDCLEVTSINEEGLIMSIRHKEFDVKGIQFHPESILTKHGIHLMKNWLLN